MLDERKKKILQALITDYISTAEPIGSRTIARKYDLGVGPATIRNEMADLEMLGYIEQLHTSSGRIPSAKGYRFYVDSLLAPEQVTDNEKVLINNWYEAKARRVEEVFQETAKILSRMTRNISMVLAPQFSQCIFKYLQFLPLDEHRVILVIVTDTGFIENKVISFPEGMLFEDLQQIAGRINSRLAGLSFDKIKASILREIKENILQDPRLFDSTLQVLREALTVSKSDRVYLGGTTQLLSQPEFRDVDKVKGLLNILEQDKLLRDIMHVTEKDGILVRIGEENKYIGIQECSMVQATYAIEGQVVGAIAVLGPTRMEYGKVMAILEFMHSHLGEILKKYKV
ncbi:Heat-inducible transcription repressor HrcA [bioreactor metagenome]|uniref:Heat-inducible transcription repressor HrcA n=1 Tax=bioreactor metagenome TaxID=1076179 RepID=A0A644TB04_9ZZZZ|nr:heat-inducible transcriptional repressor HrcA [Negativicutes bacterium]